MPVIRRPIAPPMPARPVSPVQRMPDLASPRPFPAMPTKPGGLPMSNAPSGGIAATSPPGGGGALMPGAPNMPSAPLPPNAVYKKGGSAYKPEIDLKQCKVNTAEGKSGKNKCW